MRIQVFRFLSVLSIVVAFGTVLNAQQSCSPCAPVPNACGPAPIYSEPCYECDNFVQVPCFYGKLESVFWNLDGNGRSLILRDVRGQDQTAFSGNDIDPYTNGSARVLLGLNLTAQTGIEGQYNGFHHWRSAYQLNGDNDLSLPGALGAATNDFFAADQMNISSEIDFHSAEINIVKRTRSPHLVWLAGFRYINFEEYLGINSTVEDIALYHSSDYNVRTKNDLYGGQLGVKWERPIGERLGLQCVGKAGLFSNNARQHSLMYDDDNQFEMRNVKRKERSTPFAGELNLGGYIKITENVMLTGGYNLMWVGDIARAADQMDFTYTTESSKFVATDTLFMHGAHVGAEWRF